MVDLARRADGSAHITIPSLPGFHFIISRDEDMPRHFLMALDDFVKLHVAAVRAEMCPPAASDLRDLERARGILHYPRGYLTHREAELLTQLAAEFAAIRAEAKAEGWDDAVKALREMGVHSVEPVRWANWLVRNRPDGRDA